MAAKKIHRGRSISGDQFLPDLSPGAVSKPIRCWVGLLPECPANQAFVGGIDFVKHTERLVRDPSDPTTTRRVPVIGTIGFLDPHRVDDFVDRMRCQIVRPTQKKDDGTVIGKLIRINSPAAVAGGARPYQPHPGDEPLARYAYLIPLDDHEQEGTHYPDPIEKTGIQFPGVESPEEPQALTA